MDKPERFRGSLVARTATSGVFWDHLNASKTELVLRPWLRQDIRLTRDEVGAIEFRRVRLPFIWKTDVRFRLTNGTYAPKLFVTFRTEKLRSALSRLKWPVEDGAPLNLRSVIR